MPGIIELEIISALEVVLRTEIQDLFIPAFLGEAGVKSHHLPYLSLLQAGEISYLDADGVRHYLFSGEGFMEVKDNRITLIIDHVTRGEELREEELQKQMLESEKLVKSSFQGAITPAEMQGELARQKELRLKLGISKKIKKK